MSGSTKKAWGSSGDGNLVRGGMHKLHDQKTKLAYLSAQICTPHLLALPTQLNRAGFPGDCFG